MSAADKLNDALSRLEDIAERIEREQAAVTDARIDWMLKTDSVYERAKAEKKSDAWAERVTAKAFPDLWESVQRAEGAVKASEKLSRVLTTLVDGYRTQNANEREVTR